MNAQNSSDHLSDSGQQHLRRATWRIRFAFLLLLSGCSATSNSSPSDAFNVSDLQIQDAMVIADEGLQDAGPECVTLDDCARPNCAEALICQSCELGGNCLYTGELRLFGTALSKSRQTVSDLTIRAICGEDEFRTEPGDGGAYELEIQVNQCSHLVLIAERGPSTEGYVPVVRRIEMPPPINTIEADFSLEPGEEIRCDGVTCRSRRAYSEYDSGEFFTGYGYRSGELNDLNYFGAIFESIDGELLWLHRFAYFDFRDSQSQRLKNIFFGGNSGRYALSALTFETRAWVADLVDGITVADYHSQPYSIYWDNDERWALKEPALTDPEIDPDSDGRYESIEMYAYELNIERAQWQPLRVADAPVYSRIMAQVESGYRVRDDDIAGGATPIDDALFSPDRVYSYVPDAYLRGVQTTGDYGPGMLEDANDGQYGNDYTAIPITGSGIFAIGQPVPKACWAITVNDDCGLPVLGAPIQVRGVSHGYFTEVITNAMGQGCVEVGRSESNGDDYDGDGLSNELFDVEISVLEPLRPRRLLVPMEKVESTPTTAGSCREPATCVQLNFAYGRCQ